MVRWWEPLLIPGLLQADEYARAGTLHWWAELRAYLTT
jgi:hypothetical protein